MSLYRTYRPQVFADVVGQDHVVTTLENAVKKDKLAHAYLFAGSRGTGKTSVARILAKHLMCQGLNDDAVVGQIEKGIEEGNLVDLMEIDGASNRGIDDIRDLIEKIQFSPVVAAAKVYIIDEVHMLTKEAFNALLKTLEEPPAYAYFILATTELNKIPATIQSRCQCFPFHRIREEDIIRRLQFIADSEKISVDRDALRTIAHHVEGGMRDAVSLLDQLRSLESITIEDVEMRIGSTGHEYIETILDALSKNDTKLIIETVRSIEEAGIPLDIFLRLLLSVTRDALHDAIEHGENHQSILDMLDTLLEAIANIRIAPVPGLVLESALVSLCSTDNASTEQPKITIKKESTEEKESTAEDTKKETSEHLSSKDSRGAKEEVNASPPKAPEERRRKETSEQSDTPKKNEAPNADAKETEDAIVEATDLSVSVVEKEWSTILKETQPASVRMSLKDGRVAGVDGNTVTIAFASAFHKDKVADAEASRAVEEVMEKLFKKTVRLQCTIDSGNLEDKPVIADENAINLADAASEIF